MKPPGIALGLDSGGIRIAVTRSTYAEDKLWEAVEYAQIEGWSPERLKREIAEAWAHFAGKGVL